MFARVRDLPDSRLAGMVLGGLVALLVVGVLLGGGCVGEAAQTQEEQASEQIIKDIVPLEAQELISQNGSNPDFVVLDVRTPQEFADGHLGNAENIDYYEPDFEDSLRKLDRDKTYVIYCRSGHRSAGARDMMRKLGFKEVYNVLGGILDWQRQGLPVVK